jgi:hypothetical protein
MRGNRSIAQPRGPYFHQDFIAPMGLKPEQDGDALISPCNRNMYLRRSQPSSLFQALPANCGCGYLVTSHLGLDPLPHRDPRLSIFFVNQESVGLGERVIVDFVDE